MFPVWLHVLRAREKQSCASALQVWVSTLHTRSRALWRCCDFSDMPVVHVELVFCAPCGGSERECTWSRAAFPSGTARCGPGVTHLVAASVVGHAAYSVRVILDRQFSDNDIGKYQCVQMVLDARGFADAVDFVKRTLLWSNCLCNRACGEDHPFFDRDVYRTLARKAAATLCLADDSQSQSRIERALHCVVRPASGLCETLRDCISAACDNPPATYNSRGYYFNYLPCTTDLAEGFTREEAVPGAEPRPMTCSEFLAVILLIGGRKLGTEQPWAITPGRLVEVCVAEGGTWCAKPEPGGM